MDVVDLQGSCRVKRPRHFTFLVLLAPDRQLSKDFAVGFPPESFRFDRQGNAGGPAALEVDGEVVAEARFPLFTVAAFSATGAGLTCGY